MATDLKKMVGKWWKAEWIKQCPFDILPTWRLFSAMATEIEANREEIERLKTRQDDLFYVILTPEQKARYDEKHKGVNQ